MIKSITKKVKKAKKRTKDYKKKKNIITQWLKMVKSMIKRGRLYNGCRVQYPKKKVIKKK